MTISARTLAFGTSLTLLASFASAQELDLVKKSHSVPKDAGVYQVATRTWSRNRDGSQPGSLSKVLYNNTAPSGYFGRTSRPELNMTDEGRLPSTSGHANAKADAYLVDGFQIGYCDSGVPGPLNLGVEFYALYLACSHPRNNTTQVHSTTASVPGLALGQTESCWIVTFDLSGTTHEFRMPADGDGFFDGTSSLDNFGWVLHLDDGGATTASYGPLLCYDPQGYFGCAAAEGDGTYYQDGSCTSPYGFGNFGSGLDLADRHYNFSPGGSGYSNGCFWFGGYRSTNPASGFWMVVYGENAPGIGSNYCTANANSTGTGAGISMGGTGSVAAADTVAIAEPVPNQPGIFFHASMQTASSFGCGWRCVGGSLSRGAVVVASSHRARYDYDESSSRRSLSGFENTTRHFQYWYRDPMNAAVCGHAFNLTDGISVPVVP